ncbi:MAG: pyroglutamyl-peptidase I [Acidobacteria bacterium]|nr:pyroglutamyl-peptidase I [Acidobacteriota bacterium]
MKKVLLTAFEPFDGELINPSFEVARALAERRCAAAEVQTLVLPVDRFEAINLALQALQEVAPDVVILTGEAGGRFRVTPERVAINVEDFRIPDNAGNQPQGEPIIEGAAVGYFSTLPIYAIVERLIAANIPAKISDSAGTYLCNRLFYCVRHFLESEKMPVKAGFLHLPYLHEQTLAKRLDVPGFARETLIEAVKLAIEVAVEVAPSTAPVSLRSSDLSIKCSERM